MYLNNRDMFYQNLNQGYNNPGYFNPPSGYNLNTQYQAFGPNIMPDQYNTSNNYYNDINDRISKLEKQIKSLDVRIQKLESAGNEVNDNVYMI